MKHAPSILAFSAIIGLLLLAVFETLGIPLPFATTASDIVGFSGSAGLLSFLAMDYLPARGRKPIDLRATASKPEVAKAAAGKRDVPVRVRERSYAASELMPTMGLSNDPATVSLI